MTTAPKQLHFYQFRNSKKPARSRLMAVLVLLVAVHASPAAYQVADPDEKSSLRRGLFSDAGNSRKKADQPPADASQESDPNLNSELTPEKPKCSGLWSFEFGVGVISDNTPSDYLKGNFNRLDGPGSGLIYDFTVARQIKEFDWSIGNTHLRPQLEVPFRLTLVDEKAKGIIPDFNLGLVVRWQNFPWNRFVYTTLAAGTGLSYSSPVWTADKQRHSAGEHRSKLKFWLPIEFTMALPRYPDHQLTAFIDHQSGGQILDAGGVDAWGFGFRVVF